MLQESQKRLLKAVLFGAYDLQKLRIAIGNRIVGNVRKKLGLPPLGKDKKAKKEAKELFEKIKKEYQCLTDGLVLNIHNINLQSNEGGIISEYSELVLLHHYSDMAKKEKEAFSEIPEIIEDIPIYKEFLRHEAGVGPIMAGVLIACISIEKAKYPSSLWKYAGLDVAEDGAGRSMRSEHLIDVEYTNRKGEQATKKSLTYNPFLKTKILGVLAGSFIMKKNEKYTTLYRNYRNRLENHLKYKSFPLLHKNRMAIRYMMKRFLVDLHITWRRLEGLEVYDEYSVAKLGYSPHR